MEGRHDAKSPKKRADSKGKAAAAKKTAGSSPKAGSNSGSQQGAHPHPSDSRGQDKHGKNSTAKDAGHGKSPAGKNPEKADQPSQGGVFFCQSRSCISNIGIRNGIVHHHKIKSMETKSEIINNLINAQNNIDVICSCALQLKDS